MPILWPTARTGTRAGPLAWPFRLAKGSWAEAYAIVAIAWVNGVPIDLRTGLPMAYIWVNGTSPDPKLRNYFASGHTHGMEYNSSHEGTTRHMRVLRAGGGSPAPSDHPVATIVAGDFTSASNYSYTLGSRIAPGNLWGGPLFRTAVRGSWDNSGHNTAATTPLASTNFFNRFSVMGCDFWDDGSNNVFRQSWGANEDFYETESETDTGAAPSAQGNCDSIEIGYDNASSGRKWYGHYSYALILRERTPEHIRRTLGLNPWLFFESESRGFLPADVGGSTFNVTSTEALTFTDTDTETATFARVATESLDFADTDTEIGTFVRELVESLTLSDTASETLGEIAKTATEALTFTDATSETATFARTVLDAIAFSDSAAIATKVIGKLVSEALVLTDVATAAGGVEAAATKGGLGLSRKKMRRLERLQMIQRDDEEVINLIMGLLK